MYFIYCSESVYVDILYGFYCRMADVAAAAAAIVDPSLEISFEMGYCDSHNKICHINIFYFIASMIK